MDLNQLRALAGMNTVSIITEAKKKKEELPPPADDVDPVDAAPADDVAPKGDKEKSDEEKLQEMLEKMAKKAEGKDADALVAVLRKVYDAGVKDGIAQAKEEK